MVVARAAGSAATAGVLDEAGKRLGPWLLGAGVAVAAAFVGSAAVIARALAGVRRRAPSSSP
jgi:hypothetical protein